jgi:cyclopropane fatty-acyl-phospholipid synthase-like methyltransferase
MYSNRPFWSDTHVLHLPTSILGKHGLVRELILILPSYPSVPSSSYDESYYLEYMDGANEFVSSEGQYTSARLRYILNLAQVRPGKLVLELGCGRGEATWQCARRGGHAVGLDFAPTALHISSELRARAREQGLGMELIQALAYRLPFICDCFDTVLMLDIVEHLYPEELLTALNEVKRVLRPGGQVIVHTMPNTWYYKIGYRIFRFIQRLRGKQLPTDPRDRWGYREVHVNEQNLVLLRREFRESGLKPKVWLYSTESFNHEANKYVRFAMRTLVTIYPFKWLFCNEIFAIAAK